MQPTVNEIIAYHSMIIERLGEARTKVSDATKSLTNKGFLHDELTKAINALKQSQQQYITLQYKHGNICPRIDREFFANAVGKAVQAGMLIDTHQFNSAISYIEELAEDAKFFLTEAVFATQDLRQVA